MQQAIRLWLEDKPGAPARVLNVVAAKGSNIEFLNVVKDSTQSNVSVVLLVAEVEPRLRERLIHQMNRLVNVLVVIDVTEQSRGAVELAC